MLVLSACGAASMPTVRADSLHKKNSLSEGWSGARSGTCGKARPRGDFAALDRQYAGWWVATTAQGVVVQGVTLAEAQQRALEAGLGRARFTCFCRGKRGREGRERLDAGGGRGAS